MSARCITSVLIGYHVAELAVIRLRRQNRGGGGGGGGLGGCSPQKLLASGNRGDREDWLGHGVTPTISIIFRCHSDYVYTHITGGIQKSCTVPTSLNARCLRSETGSDSQTNAEMAAGSVTSENGFQMARLRRTFEMVRGRMAVEACPVCTLEHLTALWN